MNVKDTNEPAAKINLFSFRGRIKILHLTWLAFFISFFVWFNMAPLMAAIRETLSLSDQEVKTLLILNVALTIPARIVIGMLVDKFGPRLTYSLLLTVSGALCILMATASSFGQLALFRFLLGFVGAGFVIGIRMIGEWFPARQVGLAEGIYGGWGNFGSAAAAMTLPAIAVMSGQAYGWRIAMAATGIIAIVYAVIYYLTVTDTPKGATYFKPNRTGAMEVSNRKDLLLYAILKAPLFLALALLTWKLGAHNLKMIGPAAEAAVYIALAALYFYQLHHMIKVNRGVFHEPVAEIDHYRFRQVAVLSLAYLVSFGSELAVVSMLPLFFADTFRLPMVTAGLLASGFAFMNLLARPGGGLISDRFGRRRSLLILLGGLVFGYLVLSRIGNGWYLPLAVAATMACSFFVQAAEGAVFAMVPLIKRRMTGQIAGMVGAYGNVGAVLFLTVLSFTAPQVFFMVIAAAAALTMLGVWLWLDEPSGATAEIRPDGTVEMIEVS